MVNIMFLFQTIDCSLSGYKKKCIAISDQAEVSLVIFLLILDMKNEENNQAKLFKYKTYTSRIKWM